MDFFQPILGIILTILPGIKTALLAIIPLGFLIFIHELGHFLAAKRSGIKVNTFSLGFGPKVVGFTRGETLYKLSLLPFGGYVSMEGENPTEQTGAVGEFGSASLGKRAFVVIAGPAVNLLFGFLTYWFVFTVGLSSDSRALISGLTGQSLNNNQEALQIGMIDDNGPAATAGVLSEDVIISLNGADIKSFEAFSQEIRLNPEREMELVIQRDGNMKTLTVVPNAVNDLGPRGSSGRLNLAQLDDVIIDRIEDGSLAAQAGLEVGDRIETINGEKIYNLPHFGSWIWHPESIDPETVWLRKKHQALYNNINQNKNQLKLGIRRGEETLTVTMPVHWQIYIGVQKGSTAQMAGIVPGDIITTLNGKTVDSESLYAALLASENSPITLGLIHEGVEKTVTLSPDDVSKPDKEGTFYGFGWYNSLSGMVLDVSESPLPKYNVVTAFGKGLEATWLTCTSITRTLEKLIRGQVPAKFLTGPVGIADVTSSMFDRMGFAAILLFIGFISINLAIVNLLPIPIADGGHLLFFAVEKIKGSPVPRKAQEIIQQVSVVLIIALFLYITWYDILTLFDNFRN